MDGWVDGWMVEALHTCPLLRLRFRLLLAVVRLTWYLRGSMPLGPYLATVKTGPLGAG